MSIEMNFDGVDAWSGGSFLTPGSHNVKVIEADEKPASTGTPQFVLRMEAIDGDQAGGTITDYVSVTPNSLGRVRQVLEAFGIVIPAGQFAFSADGLLGKRAKIVVREEPGRKDPTKMFSKVAAYEELGSGVGGFIPASNGASGDPLAAAAAVPAGDFAPVDDDSIPF